MRALLIVAISGCLCGDAFAETTAKYVVQQGDTCIAIAIRILGDRTAVKEIHRLNPGLGPAPHVLAPGSTLVLPERKPSGPDARLTRAHGDVKIRRPSTVTWDAAQLGLDLFRAYRVGAASEASAELTFADDAHLGMRERTIVVIYGPEKKQAKLITATAELESGTLETRLGELDGKPVVVRTPSGDADLRAGDVVITTKQGESSTLSNHRGAAVELRGRTKTPSAVKIAAGMGTRVVPGKAPEPPRPLPGTPAWISRNGPYFASRMGMVAFAWRPAERAVEYRLAVRDSRGDVIAARIVQTTSIELPLAQGSYQLTIAAFDADGLESAPSPTLDVSRITPGFVTPSGRSPADGAALPQVVALGTTIIAPAGMTCSAGATSSPRLVLERVGAVHLTCTDASGHASEPQELSVIGLEVPLAPVVVKPQPRRSPWRGEFGAYAGYQSLGIRRPIYLGAADRSQAVDDGFTSGLRGSAFHNSYGIELEVGFSSLDHLAADGYAQALLFGLHGVLRHDEGWASLRLLGGLGTTSIVRDTTTNMKDTAIGFSWGGVASLAVRGVQIRFDLRHVLARADDGLGQGMQATVGVGFGIRP